MSIRFDGQAIAALEGESIAAALSAAGIVAFRRTAGGAPRGLYCGMGACFDCVVTVDGRIGRRACLEKVADGMEVTGATPALPAPLAPEPAGVVAEDRACDLLVVGAGPAGLSAAIAAAEAGASVIALDERDAPGGQFHKPLAPSHADAAPDAQFREGQAVRQRALAAGVKIETGATVWGAFGANEVAAVVGGIAITFRPRRLVLAPGAHERPVPVPGWTLPGGDDYRRSSDIGAGSAGLARATRADRRQWAAEPAISVRVAGGRGAGGGGGGSAAPRPGAAALRHAWTMLRGGAWSCCGKGFGILPRCAGLACRCCGAVVWPRWKATDGWRPHA